MISLKKKNEKDQDLKQNQGGRGQQAFAEKKAPEFSPYVPEVSRSGGYSRIPASRSSSSQKRTLDSNGNANASATGKKQKTKVVSPVNREHIPRSTTVKSAKK